MTLLAAEALAVQQAREMPETKKRGRWEARELRQPHAQPESRPPRLGYSRRKRKPHNTRLVQSRNQAAMAVVPAMKVTG